MRFSIITPSYNQGRFLPDCIESVLAQVPGSKERRGMPADASGPPTPGAEPPPISDLQSPISFTIEHIVTDAGSTDETRDVLKRYPHLKWTSEADDGMSDGINKGFRQATGDWVMWLNCDDYLLPGALEKVAAHARAHAEASVIHGDCVFVDLEGRTIRRKFDTPVDEWDFLFVGCCIPSTATFYHRRILEAGHFLDVAYRNCMDWEYYLRLSRSGFQFSYLAEALAGFRWHEESTTQKHWQRMIEEGRRCQMQHIKARNLPDFIGSPGSLAVMRKIYQVRRVAKRITIHKRIR